MNVALYGACIHLKRTEWRTTDCWGSTPAMLLPFVLSRWMQTHYISSNETGACRATVHCIVQSFYRRRQLLPSLCPAILDLLAAADMLGQVVQH